MADGNEYVAAEVVRFDTHALIEAFEREVEQLEDDMRWNYRREYDQQTTERLVQVRIARLEQALSYLCDRRKRMRDAYVARRKPSWPASLDWCATHRCFAYRCGPHSSIAGGFAPEWAAALGEVLS